MSRVIWLIHVCDVTHSCVWSESCTSLMSLIPYVLHYACMCVTQLNYTCKVIHAYVWHDPCMYVKWLNYTWDMTHAYVWHGSCICVIWLIHMCDTTTHELIMNLMHTYVHVCTRRHMWLLYFRDTSTHKLIRDMMQWYAGKGHWCYALCTCLDK